MLAERLALLVDAVDEYAIFMLDPLGYVVTWNSGAQRIKGYTADEIIGGHFSAFYTPEDVSDGTPARELAVALAEGHFNHEGWRVRQDGGRFWANVLIAPVVDSNGRHEGFAKVTRDDTDRQKAAQRDRQLELLAERDRISKELTDTVVHRIYGATLSLHSALTLTTDPEVVSRIRASITELDSTVRQIRMVLVDQDQRAGAAVD